LPRSSATSQLFECDAGETLTDSIPWKVIIAHRTVRGAALSLLPVALWCLTHRYSGLVGDSGLYAIQALSRTDTGLARDVFLSNASQDRYTIFSPIYAFFIRTLGVRAAAVWLIVLCKIGFYATAWAFTRKLFDAGTALLATALLVVLPLEYGAYHVFRVAEDMLTARSMAEALAMGALCLHVYGRRTTALVVAAFALSIHALMALPMLLLLLSLRFGVRASLLGALASVVLVLCAAAAAAVVPQWTPVFLRVMDPIWLDVVRERSQFVFLQLWRLQDWELNARPFVSLALTMLVIRDERIRRLCASAMIVGAAGLAIACAAGLVGPVAVLFQGQAWRWVWIPGLTSLLMLAPTASLLWRSGRCGPLCAVLMLMAWLVSVLDGVYMVAAALCLWYGREHIPALATRYLRWAVGAIGVLVLARIVGTGWTALSALTARAATEGRVLEFARALLGLDCVAAIMTFLLVYWLLRRRSLALPALTALALATATVFAAPRALEDPTAEGSAAQIEEFADWRAVIPPGDNVFVVPRYYTAGFTWFTLGRPSYLTVDQSSGVIFSRATAVEVRRRSEVLLPMEEPDWRLLSRRVTHDAKFDASARALTRDRLVQICADPQMNFVVAREDVGFEPIRHRRPGAWNGYNLYDCRRVNSLKGSATR
jgi:hypothetical protein